MDLTQIIKEVRDSVALNSKNEHEFILPDNYLVVEHNQTPTRNACSIKFQETMQNLKTEILLHSQHKQEFQLPFEYQLVQGISSKKFQCHGKKIQSVGSSYSNLHTPESNILNKAVSALKDEVRYQSTLIQDFNLPFNDLIEQRKQAKENNEGSPDDGKIIPKYKKDKPKKSHKNKTQQSTRGKREKDKERKRKQRNMEKESISITKQLSETQWQKMYKDKPSYRQYKKRYSVEKYYSNMPYKEAKKDKSKEKYRLNEKFQEEVKNRSKTKYHLDVQFQQEKKKRSITKYHMNLPFQQEKKKRSITKYHMNLPFQQAVKQRSKTKYRSNIQFREAVKKASVQKYAFDSGFHEKLKRMNLLRYRQKVIVREKYKERLRRQYKHDLLIRQNKMLMMKQRRLNKNHNMNDIAMFFRQQVRDGPTYVCSVCHKFKFKKQVVICDKLKYSKKGTNSIAMANHCITQQFLSSCANQCQNTCEIINHKQWICFTCHYHVLKGQLPADAYVNGLQLPHIPDQLNSLNKLEKQLISIRIPFMKIIQLPKGNQRGFIGPCVSVPTDVEKTTNVLPRCETETELIRCKLKRKLEYKGYTQYEYVSRKKICNGLKYLQEKNPYYHDKLLNKQWIDNTPSDFEDLVVEETEHTEFVPQEEDRIDNHNDEDESVKNRGLPSDTCLQPVDIGQEILDQHFDHIFCVAPGEGNTPVRMLQEEGNEAMSFPVQFPEGSFGSFDAKRSMHLTRSKYFHARLFSADSRFSSDTSYIFYAQYLSELEQVISKVSIALRKSSGKDQTGNIITASMLTDKNQLKKILTTDQGYKFMTPIRGTPPYWQATLRDLMASIRQLGIPTWFATFSAADLRWEETLQVLLEQQKSTESLEDLDWTGKSKVLQNNPVMSAVMFDYRFNTFLKEIIIKRNIIGNVKDHFHRIEFQQRGSPHAHCLFWIKDAPLLDTHDDKTVCDFVDKYVTCDLPDVIVDPELHEIVTHVQQHSKNHSKSCAKKGTKCRFNFPRPPSENTFISRTPSTTGPTVQRSSKQTHSFAKDVLLRLWNTINNANLEHITTENLFTAAGISQEEFESASNILTKRTNITLKRKPADSWINQYNPSLLRCWNANMDLQYITDAYSCVMYIISYISKAEREMGVVLENARKEAAEGNCDAQDAMKQIGGAYFRQREVSAQEATYRACGLHLKESSRKVQFLPVGNNPVKMSLPLNIIQMKANQLDDSIWMHSLYDRYKARPLSSEFDIICYASFSSEYRVLSPSQIPKKPSQYVFKLQSDLGYIRKHSRTEAAVVAYPRFSKNKNPELYFKSSLQLFLPHRMDGQLKPLKFKTYEEMYFNGAVALDVSKKPQKVKAIVESNRQVFEHNVDELDEAQELLEKQGPLEDAWALIAPESEAERIETQSEKEHLGHEDSVEIPDLDTSNKKHRGGPLVYQIRQWCLDEVNGKNPDPFKIFINGGAGTGKSHLIKCLCYEANKILSPHAPNPDDIVVLVTAPTATAAFNIGGTTLHQAFSLSKSLPFPYIYMRDEEINKLRSKLQNLHILIIDEISMVGQRVLLYVSERLRQIKQSGNALFGNICVVAVGDFYQLPPVKQKCLYDLRPENFFPLWSSNFSLVELNQIMRQKEGSEFAHLLNRLRVKKKTEHLLPGDYCLLKSCLTHSVPEESLHIFATNKEIDFHNSKMIAKVCQETETIMAQDYDRNPRTGEFILQTSPYDTSHDFLPPQLIIGPKARVMLIRNIDITIGLVNGVIGTVISILPGLKESSLPCAVKVLFDNKSIGRKPVSSSQPREHIPIDITPIEENLKKNAVRHQFPLQLAWACTTHKVQGLTTDKAVVSMKNIFAAGMAYVALSRVRSLDGLVIQDLDADKIYCTEQISTALQRMPKYLVQRQDELNLKQNLIRILLHNIQGLVPHIEDLQANCDIQNVKFICLTETWMENKSASPNLEHFHLIHKPRSESYTSTKSIFHDLSNKKHGGVGIYVRNQQQYTQLSLQSCNIECIGVNIDIIKTNILVIYRPVSYTTSIFLEQLQHVIDALPPEDGSTIVMGDFNEDILKSKSPIQLFMEQNEFKQILNKATTDGDTLIDH
ncbi:uncharacterized protein, partial [Mytilus edulis]|uniref:uncharacterized protein n=1 Tax=Mytilus edulis TaxID=6550 RepID=UPI0039F0DB55